MMIYPLTVLKPLRLLSILLFLMGVGLFTTSARTSLTCDRTANSVSCLIRKTTSLGIIETAVKRIDAVQSIKIDHRVKRTRDIEAEDTPRRINRDVYGVVVIGDEQVLLDAYGYDREVQERRLQTIKAFLQDPSQKQFRLDITNFWSPVLTFVAWGGAIALFFFPKRKKH